ncbi:MULTISPECIES: nickel/cobalt transporter [Halomonadaceae]|jgi:ABC-type nickel/cobalt efflux system permease component RcnA|uniref:Nickel/cobalt efflux system n=1 Tax=Vreelandella titanicae BH1 TaxID=1204738 RepID=L9U9N3_9GAMM|nr:MULTISPECIES: nickel/cobalt transporter [Halomonas]ELY21467.1 Nickel/cobalt transporter, high-affinity [Halomonas titanicae BH1]KIN13092.1 sodium:proton antiporter [Halomonas sp. KHS3]MCD1586809.1 nickel/cobalt transporter [Halomonas sp. IOP_14]MCE7520133.1 nickel/cobalt transporter [Halomonas titanicae]NVE91743.1 nickel/cobalt transporter [Halomonas titanicae]
MFLTRPFTRQLGLMLGLLLAAAVLIIVWQGGFQSVSYQLLGWQRDLHRSLTLAITELSRTPTMATWVSLLGISFAYGVFHAAGPGHGKAVLATYLASHGGAVKRALGLSFAASLLQGVTAIALVVVLVYGLGWITRQAMGSVAWVEQASFLLVAALGAWLCWRAVKQLRRAYQPERAAHSHSPGHEHNQDHEHNPNHEHSHGHDHSHCCGGAHHIEPHQALDWRTAMMTVGAIGMRPCSGAVLMLGAASLLGQFEVGVASVVAMSIGTGITVSALALASIFARGWAQRRLSKQQYSQRSVQKATGWVALAGGALIVVIGISLSVAGVAQPASGPLLNEPPARQGHPLTG